MCTAAWKRRLEGYACDLVLLSPSSQYSSVCISVSRDTVLWKANLSSSPLKMDRLLASSCFAHKVPQLKRTMTTDYPFDGLIRLLAPDSQMSERSPFSAPDRPSECGSRRDRDPPDPV